MWRSSKMQHEQITRSADRFCYQIVIFVVYLQMFSKIAAKKKLGMKENFRWRGHGEVSRIESLSDAVFGLAVTLLVISQEVPHSYSELVNILMGSIPFAACFAQLMLVWYEHYKFYRRYNLQAHTMI